MERPVRCSQILLLGLGAAAFIASAAKHLPPSDVWCILYPSLRHFLKSDVVVIDEQSLLITLKPHVCDPFLMLRITQPGVIRFRDKYWMRQYNGRCELTRPVSGGRPGVQKSSLLGRVSFSHANLGTPASRGINPKSECWHFGL